MNETIKLTEVTDVITPEEETTPENYNFAMESTWEETIYSQGGGGGGVTPEGSLDISENGTYDVTDYAEAAVNVPNSYSASDEGKVVDDGALVAQTSATYTENDTYDTTLVNEVVVNVPTGVTPTGTKSITTNGTHDVTDYASASVNVPNSYSASDEGKVVDDGALVAQTSATYTENDTYDTTLINEVTVNVDIPTGGVVTQDSNGYLVLDDEAGSGGGTVRTETGSITTTSQMQSELTIVHTLNTQNVFGVVYIEPNENDEVTTTRGYQVIYARFDNLRNMIDILPNDLYADTTLVSNYTSSETKTASYTDVVTSRIEALNSAWTNKAAAWTQSLLNAWVKSATDTSITIGVYSTSMYFGNSTTYKWKLWGF